MQPSEDQFLAKRPVMVSANGSELSMSVDLPPRSVCSIVVENVRPTVVGKRGVTAGMVQEMSSHAARAAAHDRLNGGADPRTEASWALLEHACSCAHAALESVISDATREGLDWSS